MIGWREVEALPTKESGLNERIAGALWPVPVVQAYQFEDTDRHPGYVVQVHLALEDDVFTVTGIVVRRTQELERMPAEADEDGISVKLTDAYLDYQRHRGRSDLFTEPVRRLSWREASRLPVGRYMEAALVLAQSRIAQGRKVEREGGSLPMFEPEALATADEILLPRGRPERGRGTAFYRDIARAHQEYKALGLSPIAEIARRKKVRKETVRQWIFRARDKGFLLRAPKQQRRRK